MLRKIKKTGRPGQIIRLIIGLFFACLLAAFLAPLTWHLFNFWIASFSGGCLLGLICVIFWSPLKQGLIRLWKTRIGKVVYGLIALVTVFVVGMFITASIHMLVSAHAAPAPNATLIVLGAQIQGDHPSQLLTDRLNVAAAYMEQNPNSIAVVCGGQGPDEHYTEALVMKRYLVNKGISASRIYEEDTSTSTRENVENAARIIREQGLSEQVVTVTQEFHQYRSQRLAREQKLTVAGGCSARTPLSLLPLYWLREFAGISRYWLLGI